MVTPAKCVDSPQETLIHLTRHAQCGLQWDTSSINRRAVLTRQIISALFAQIVTKGFRTSRHQNRTVYTCSPRSDAQPLTTNYTCSHGLNVNLERVEHPQYLHKALKTREMMRSHRVVEEKSKSGWCPTGHQPCHMSKGVLAFLV